MSNTILRTDLIRLALLIIVAVLEGACTASDEEPVASPQVAVAADSEWRNYGNDPGGTKYSSLAAIDTSNVHRLEVAWIARTGDFAGERLDDEHAGVALPTDARAAGACGSCHGESIRFETTPIMADGTLYVSTPANRVLALDPATGEERWVWDPAIDVRQSYSEGLISRGVSLWVDAGADPRVPCRRRIFQATIDARLIALDAATGRPCTDFGEAGTIRLDRGVGLNGREVDTGEYLVTSPPALLNDILVVGSAIGDNRRKDVESGVVRAYDARTGLLRWSFDPIPRGPEHPAWEDWSPEAAAVTGAANVWSIISTDAERDLVFLPTGSAAPDFYGGARPGRNDFANSLVAVRGTTGEVVWSFQVVHHDLWDYDVPAQPVLIDLERNGEMVPAVVVGTKMGHLFVLHRETGEPLFPVEERAVPPSDVPGEEAWPTQPFPVLPKPLHEATLTPDDAFGVDDADRAYCRDWIARLRYEGVFTPPSLSGTILWPGFAGGLNWDGMAWDPARQMLVVPIKLLAMFVQLHVRPAFEAAQKDRQQGLEYADQEGTPYGMTRMPMLSPKGIPCSPPPWSKLMAVDMRDGTLVWERPLGRIPAGMIPGSDEPGPEEWGSLAFGGPLATAGGITIIAAGQDDRIRAFATTTGALLWEAELPAGGQAAPMTYRYDGRQYVVIAAGGRSGIGSTGDYIVAFALPQR
ncbi:MAG TPA: pyrroloquinoline quinone-dependent dehydrogenase [Longimicrobiales bacterium]|nr:pyrroloquinoline quinone-dependent dehydrogenase [Longimicrobiales bacterium]